MQDSGAILYCEELSSQSAGQDHRMPGNQPHHVTTTIFKFSGCLLGLGAIPLRPVTMD